MNFRQNSTESKHGKAKGSRFWVALTIVTFFVFIVLVVWFVARSFEASMGNLGIEREIAQAEMNRTALLMISMYLLLVAGLIWIVKSRKILASILLVLALSVGGASVLVPVGALRAERDARITVIFETCPGRVMGTTSGPRCREIEPESWVLLDAASKPVRFHESANRGHFSTELPNTNLRLRFKLKPDDERTSITPILITTGNTQIHPRYDGDYTIFDINATPTNIVLRVVWAEPASER